MESGGGGGGKEEEKEKLKSVEVVVSKEKLCRRCKATYAPSANTRLSCRFHPSFFICHDDQKRYYQLHDSDPPYAAKFYDCCGAKDPGAAGCTTDFHLSYDDD